MHPKVDSTRYLSDDRKTVKVTGPIDDSHNDESAAVFRVGGTVATTLAKNGS